MLNIKNMNTKSPLQKCLHNISYAMARQEEYAACKNLSTFEVNKLLKLYYRVTQCEGTNTHYVSWNRPPCVALHKAILSNALLRKALLNTLVLIR
jgi:hypothetical protein